MISGRELLFPRLVTLETQSAAGQRQLDYRASLGYQEGYAPQVLVHSLYPSSYRRCLFVWGDGREILSR
jgi:hypothetical protein